MKYQISKEGQSAYLQLYAQLREDIIQGNYLWGHKLPSKRLLAQEVGVSNITVEHAYALLCDEGYAEARQRSGYFVIFRPADGFAVSADSTAFHPMHPASPVSSEFSVSLLSKTMRRVLAEQQDRILEKTPNTGSLELREAIRQYLARNRGIYADTEQIVIGSGAEYLYGLIIDLLGRDRVYAIEEPSYEKLELIYRTAGVDFVRLPLSADGIDSTALNRCQADILHTTPYRSYPSGVTASATKRHEYIHWSNQAQRYIIESDHDSEFSVSSKPTETLFTLAKQDNVIYLNTFSKTISPALRVAYMVLPKKLVQPFTDSLGFYSCTVPTFEQFVLAELIQSGDFERHINRIRRKKRKEKAI